MKKPKLLSRLGLAVTRARNFVINAVFLLLVAAALVGLFQGVTGFKVPDRAALVIDPAGELVEEAHADYDLLGLVSQSEPVRQTGINDLLRAVDHATDDDRIRTIVLLLDDLTAADSAHARQLGEALERFKAAGKEVIAFGHSYSQGQYAIASFADAIYMHPFGQVGFPGYGRYSPYLKDLLDNWGVNVHLFRVGKYKEAAEPFTRDGMSPEAREVNQALVNDVWAAYRQTVLANRSLDAGAFDRYARAYDEVLEEFGGDAGRAALEFRLVDELMTPDHARDRIAAAVGGSDEDGYPRIGFGRYLQTLPPAASSMRNIALITAQGPIVMGKDREVAAADNLVALIRKAREDKSVAALVLRIDSPGGSALASELIREELEVAQQHDKPVVASMGPVAASGGYWIASTANRIIAHPTTITGSIGVVGLFLSFERTLSDLGIESDGVGSLPLTGSASPLLGMNESAKRVLQANVSGIYERFIHLVARGRDMTPEAVDEIGQGRVWLGRQAMDIGLVDGLGGLADAVEAAAELAGLEQYGIKRLTTPIPPGEQFLRQLMESEARGRPAGALSSVSRQLRSVWSLASRLNDPGKLYAVCEPCLALD